MNRPFLNAKVPDNYVAGVGRGAMGFTTRSDIGPARPAPPAMPSFTPITDSQFGQAPVGYIAGRGRGMGDLARGQNEITSGQVQQEQDRGDYSESNYDEFSGYGEKLFVGGAYEEDDAEADQIYDKVDGMMDNRRKRSREQQMLLEKKRAKNERPRIADQFADLKRELSTVTAEQWDAIPDVGDHSLKLKQSRKKESYAPVPDFLIDGSNSSVLQSIDPSMDTTSSSLSSSNMMSSNSIVGGTQSSLSGTMSNALTSKLDKMSDSVTGQTVVDPKGYLTNLNSLKITSQAEIGDIKKARILLQSVTTTNPKHGPGWIAAARVEEFASKMPQARKVILQGCEQCPTSEDVWLEAARLHPTDVAKALLANAVMHLPTSVKIWMYAAELEQQESRKKAVLRRSLEFVPNSVTLWKAAIQLENVTDARIMLARAVECVPHSVEMWLALAKLESHENARRVLNQAREAIPTEKATWITAAKLEEAHGNGHLVGRIIEKMIASLSQYQVIIDRDTWIREAEDCEHASAVLTGASIIRNTIHLGVEAEDRRTTWMDDAETCLSHQPPSIETARAILAYAIEKFPNKKLLWQQAAMLEKQYGTSLTLENKLMDGVKHCPQAEVLWLMAAKEKWLAGDVPGARDILLEAFNANPQSQQIWLAAIKLEWENNEYVRARLLLSKARERAPSERVWLKSILLEREVGDVQAALQLLEQALQRYPTYTKYYMIAGQICSEELQEFGRARNFYLQGIKVLPQCVTLWCLLIMLEEKVKGAIKARATGEMARLKLPGNELLWLESIRLERRAGNDKLADGLMAKAMQECPKSGILWAEELLTCPKTLQKSRSIDALKKCNDDPLVLVAVARLFARGGRAIKARRRYDRAITCNPKLGDAWAYYYAFEYVQTFKHKLLKKGIFQEHTNTISLSNNSNNNNSNNSMISSSNNRDLIAMNGGIDSVDDAEEEDEDADDDNTAEETSLETISIITESERKGLLVLADIEKRCVESVPNQGELWCKVSKETKIRRLEIGNILRIVAERILGYSLEYLILSNNTINNNNALITTTTTISTTDSNNNNINSNTI